MDYFDGLSFIGGADCPEYGGVQRDRFFDGYYGVQYNHGGVMEYRIGNNPIRSYEGSFVFVSRPGTRFYYGSPAGQHRHHCYICFNGPRVMQFITGGLIAKKEPLEPTPVVNSEKFLASMRRLLEILHEKHQGFSCPRAVLLLEDLLLQIHEQPEEGSVSSHLAPGLRQLMEAIAANPQLDWDFRREAGDLKISYAHFRRIFTQYCGHSPGHYLILSRLQFASERLLRSDDQLGTIAEQLGFSSQFYFSRLFKKYYKLPPLAYRREFREG